MPNFVKVANTSDLRPGENKVVSANGNEIALFNVNGEFFATSNNCPHRGGPLGEGFLEGETVTCPWHGWQFNVKTGGNETMPGPNISCYKVKVDGDSILVEFES